MTIGTSLPTARNYPLLSLVFQFTGDYARVLGKCIQCKGGIVWGMIKGGHRTFCSTATTISYWNSSMEWEGWNSLTQLSGFEHHLVLLSTRKGSQGPINL